MLFVDASCHRLPSGHEVVPLLSLSPPSLRLSLSSVCHFLSPPLRIAPSLAGAGSRGLRLWHFVASDVRRPPERGSWVLCSLSFSKRGRMSPTTYCAATISRTPYYWQCSQYIMHVYFCSNGNLVTRLSTKRYTITTLLPSTWYLVHSVWGGN